MSHPLDVGHTHTHTQTHRQKIVWGKLDGRTASADSAPATFLHARVWRQQEQVSGLLAGSFTSEPKQWGHSNLKKNAFRYPAYPGVSYCIGGL